MSSLINHNLEFYEVLNAFPILKEKLKKLSFNLSDLKEGESICEYFGKKSYSQDEIDIVVRKLNSEINYYLRNGDKVEKTEEKPQKTMCEKSSSSYEIKLNPQEEYGYDDEGGKDYDDEENDEYDDNIEEEE